MKCQEKLLLLSAILIAFNFANAQPPQWLCGGANDPSSETRSASCTPSSTAYSTKYGRASGHVPVPNVTPIKTIRISFHFFQDNSGNNNWINDASHLSRLSTIVSWMNSRLASLPAPSYTTSPATTSIANSTIQYEITGTYFYQDSYLNSLSTNSATLYNNYVNAIDPSRIANSLPIYVTKGSYPAGSTVWGFGIFPSESALNQSHHVVTFNGSDNIAQDWAWMNHLLHELGHNLDLYHPYDNNQYILASDYLSDLFNTTWMNYCSPPSNWACKHYSAWSANPWATSPYDHSTNNIMSGTQYAENITPLQLGLINRSLAIKSVRKYVKPITSSTNNWIVNQNETWDFDIQMYQNILVTNGATLTIKCKVAMANNGKITVDPGAHLVIDGGTATSWGSMWTGIVLEGGSTLLVDNAAIIENALLAIDSKGGAQFTVQNGSKLNKNFRGIYMQSYAGTHPGVIKNSTISCLDNSGNPTNLLLSPKIGVRAYSGIEISSVTQATIGVDAAGQTNTFDNLEMGIINANSNLTVYNNNFTRINYQTNAQRGRGISSTNAAYPSAEKTLTVGGYGGNGYRKNTFTNSYLGALANTNQDVSILSNTFNNLAHTAAYVYYCGTSGNTVAVSDNTIDDCQTGIYSLGAAGSTSFTAANNNINLASPTGNSKPNSTAITITNSSQSAAGAPGLNILYNNIKRISTGILVTNFTGPNIETNIISDLSDLGSSIYSNGMLITACPYSIVESNEVHAVNSQNSWWTNGIRFEPGCNNSIVLYNTVDNVGGGLFFSGACQSTETAKNHMKNNYWGFVLNAAETGAQYGDSRGCENSWEGTFIGSNLLSNYSNGTLSPWKLYHTAPGVNCNPVSGPCTDPYPANFVNTFAGPGATAIPTSESTVVSGRSGDDWKHEQLLRIAKGQNNYPKYTESHNWMARYNLYNVLKNDPALQNGDTDLQSFTDNTALTAMGQLSKVNTLLSKSNPDFSAAEDVLKGLVASNVVERNLADVFAITIAHRTSDSLTAAQIKELKKIAVQCPYEGGYGVYNARVLLSIVDNTVYMNACEIVPVAIGKERSTEEENSVLLEKEIRISIFPNPTNDKLNIAIHLEEGQMASIEVYDLTGKLVSTNILNVVNDVTEISTSLLSPGLYIYKLNVNNENVKSGKLSIMR